MARKKKYNPVKEIAKITGTTTSVVLGTQIVGTIGSRSPHTPASVYSAMGMMGNIPMVQAGGSVIRSLKMLEVKPKRRKKRR